MIEGLLDPDEPPERQNARLLAIAEALVRRIEETAAGPGAEADYAMFERAVFLEDEIRTRTRDLERTLDLLNQSNAQLSEATAAAEAARATLSGAIEAVRDGFALFDAEERLTLFNSRFAKTMPDIRDCLTTGITFGAYIDLVAGSRYLALPAGAGRRAWADQRMRRHGETYSVFNVGLRGDRWLQVSEHRTGAGETVILQTDVTDIMRIERRARTRILDNQARLIGATLEHITQGVCVFDDKADLVGWNRQFSDMLSIPVALLRRGTPFDRLLRAGSTNLRFGSRITPAEIRAWVDRPSPRPTRSFDMIRGGQAVLQVTMQEAPDRGFVISVTDITTERREKATLEERVRDRTNALEDALAAAERASATRSRFVAAASHDILQPLSAAKLFVASVAEGGDPAPQATLAKAQNALQGVEDIIGALLDISRLEAGSAAVEVGPVRLGRILRQVVDEFTPLAERKGLRLRLFPTSAVIQSDATYARRILQNLVANAVRYTTAGGILVGVRPRGGRLRVEVHDTGPGIADADQDAIFQEFRRLGDADGAEAGLGLGLAVVARASALLGHPLGLTSIPGRGSTFAVTFPLAEVAPPPAPSIRTARLLLVVDGAADRREDLAAQIEQAGAGVLEAATADGARALLDEVQVVPDACLVAADLDAGDGPALIADLQARFGAMPARLIAPGPVTDTTAGEVPTVGRPLSAADLDALLAPSG